MSKDPTGEQREQTVKLQYMNNAYSTLQAFWGLRGHLALAVIVLSLILLAITTGVVYTNETFTFLGVALKISLLVFLAAGAIVLAALSVSWWAVLLRVQYLRKDIERLYKETLGYREEAIDDELRSAFHSATFYGALMAPYQSRQWRIRQDWFVKWYDYLVSRWVADLLVGVLPIVTEAVIFVRVCLDLWLPRWRALVFGWLQQSEWLLFCLEVCLAALLAICIIVTISAWIKYQRERPNDA